MKLEFFYSIGIFMVKVSTKLGLCLRGLLGIHLSLKRLVVFYGHVFRDPRGLYARSYYASLWCDMYNSSVHNVSSCPYCACYTHSDSSLPLTPRMRLEAGQPFGLAVVLA